MRSTCIFGFAACAVLAVTGCASQSAAVECATGIVCPGGMQCAAAQAVCLRDGCGNGAAEAGEQCDDGNVIDGDGCSARCRFETCGDGVVNNGEQCDAGGESATCNIDCTHDRCGDGKVNRTAGEECDDAAGNADDRDCTASCKKNVCGDGLLDALGTRVEICDSSGVDTPECNANCTTPSCGDLIVNARFSPDPAKGHEQCDPPSAIDGCSAACRLEHCGNGQVDALEECDEGPDGGASCSRDCRKLVCGNGIVDPSEQCDDGARNGPGQRCNRDCQFNVCGDGDRAGSEQCDDGASGVPADSETCDADCTAPVCGDGHLNTAAGEVCDSGPRNGASGDPCSLRCQLVTCGNGTVEQGEQCDDGQDNGPDRRCTACKLNVCGDGNVLVGVEQCDGGAGGIPRDTASCDHDCTAAVCGDGHANTLAGEVCDNGPDNGTPGDLCDSFCHWVACGNGFVDPGEQCDPGTGEPASDSQTCDSDCTAVVCGDGHRNAAAEVCDDGPDNGTPCPYNDRSCVRCNARCTAMTQPGGPFCGDSLVNGDELCDQGLLHNGQQCAYGDLACLWGARPVCNVSCSGFVAGPNGPFCGDGVVQLPYREQCDPGGGLVPADSAGCDRDCTFAICGDGLANTAAGEGCDDGNSDACGTCTAMCGDPVPPAAAMGAIIVSPPGGGDVRDGDTFTLADGVPGHPAIVFELDRDGAVTLGHVGVAFTPATSSAELAAALRDAIDHDVIVLDITATVGATVSGATSVVLVNDHRSAWGNQPIGRTGTIASRFVFKDLVNGAAGDCAAGVGCASNADCGSGVCSAATGRCL